MSAKPLNRKDLRRHPRYDVKAGVLQVSWVNKSGNMEVTRTLALNVSEHGIGVQLPEAALATRVQFRSERCLLTGTGTIRFCRRTAGKYVVGVEFADGLQWRAPEGEVRQPIPLCDNPS